MAILAVVAVVAVILTSGGDGDGSSNSRAGTLDSPYSEVLSGDECLDMRDSKGQNMGGLDVDRSDAAWDATTLTDAQIVASLKVKDGDDGDLASTWIDPESLSERQAAQLVASAREHAREWQAKKPDSSEKQLINHAYVIIYGDISEDQKVVEDGKFDSPDFGICVT